MKIQYSFVFLGLLSLLSHAQEISFDSISLQGAPALALSGSAPTEIARPTGAQQLGFALLGGASGESFAFETKPYWWSDHVIPDFYEKDYGWDVFQQTFSISGARYELQNSAGVDVAEMSFGFSFNIIRGSATEKFKEAFAKHSGILNKYEGVNLPSTNEIDIQARLQRQADESKLSEYSDTMVSEMVKGRIGWNMSFAAATAYQFSDTDYNGGDFAKTGGWLITSYSQNTGGENENGDQISYMGILRYVHDQSPGIKDSYYDVGGRLLWSLDRLPLSISAEYIKRFAENTTDSERISALVEYQIDDKFSLFASHGVSFDQSSGKNEVFTAAGLSFGFGR